MLDECWRHFGFLPWAGVLRTLNGQLASRIEFLLQRLGLDWVDGRDLRDTSSERLNVTRDVDALYPSLAKLMYSGSDSGKTIGRNAQLPYEHYTI